MSTTLYGAPITLKRLYPILLRQYRSKLLRSTQAVFLHGPPGVGKTSLGRQVADKEGGQFVRNNLVTTDYIQLCGLPDTEEGRRRKLNRPARVPLIDIPDEGEGILMFDDFTHAPKEIQASALDLALERRLNDSKVGPGWLLLFVGNDTGGVVQLQAGIANRFRHFYVEADLDSFREWGLTNNVMPELLSFVEGNPELLCQLPTQQEKAYPTPRSWAALSRDLTECYPEGVAKLPDLELMDACSSYVGAGPSGLLLAYLKTFGLVDLPTFLAGTADKIKEQAARMVKKNEDSSPTALAIQFSLCAKLVRWWMTTDMPIKQRGRSFGYALRYLDPNFQTMVLRDLTHLDRNRLLKIIDDLRRRGGNEDLFKVLIKLGRTQSGMDLAELTRELETT